MVDVNEKKPDLEKIKKKVWLKDTELARLINISVSKLRNDRYLGRGLAYHTFGRSVRYYMGDLKKEIEAGRVEPSFNSPNA